jgi:hypothetical protein
MTEIDWLSGKEPWKMLSWLLRQAEPHESACRGRMSIATDRKLRLFACGAVRQVWRTLVDERSRRAVEAAEQYADGEAMEQELATAGAAAWAAEGRAVWDAAWATTQAAASDACNYLVRSFGRASYSCSPEEQADLFRCVFGNPFRPVRATRQGEKWTFKAGDPGPVIALPIASWTAWQGGTVRRLAQAIYAERAWDRLPFLADALEEADCTDQAIIDHLRPRICPECRGKGRRGSGGGMQCLGCYGTGKIGHTGPHTRGCWVLDILLGKS